MQITEIYYEKVFPIAPYINEKIGVKVTVDPSEHSYDVIERVKEIVNGWGHKLVEERPQGTTEHKTYGSYGSVMPIIDNKEDDKEFEKFKQHLSTIEFRDDAQAYLNTTSFKFALEAKRLVNDKPIKPTF